MEENITKRKANTINITIYGNSLNGRELAEQLTAFINPEGNDVREFIFRTVSINIALNENDKTADLFIVAGNKETDKDTNTLLQTLKRDGRPYLTVSPDAVHLKKECTELLAELEKALGLGFTPADFADIHHKGINIEAIRLQLLIFKNGISKTRLKKPALIDDGIFALPKETAIIFADFFDSKKNNFTLTKFVPASGAASRMFKFLCEFSASFDPEKETINAYINRKKDNSLRVFLVGLEKFPFYKEIAAIVRQNEEFATWNKDRKTHAFIKIMLSSKWFNFANKPKGILPFHHYGDYIATPVYEHLKESVAYGSSKSQANIHFTISEDHLDGFLDAINDVKPQIEEESGTAINFSFSYQEKRTDTLAVHADNIPFRENGQLLFRPGGHGALIENLAALDSDIVFIKNIDNVSHNNIHTIALYKKALAGILIELQEQLFSYLNSIDQNEVSEQDIEAILTFAEQKLLLHVPADISKYTLANKTDFVKQLFNRPIRICGMVKNEGEPGGGPFWIEEEKGKLSLQIVESSQIDLDNKEQKEIFLQASHFNPVDLVCGLKNYKGEFFNLHDFVDTGSGFITYKNKMGKDVKSYELPGLWNGAMAGWITIFAEVPLETFNPVKTVNDLLKPAHQPQ